MRPQDTVRIDTHALVERVEASGLKQWALADTLGVHRKTVSRWLSGKIQRVERANVEALASVLGCTMEDLSAAAPPVFATRNEQARAATLVRERELVELLSPTGDWELAERLIKATLRPELALADLGRLYNLLSITAWRQQRLDEAAAHAEQALEVGRRTDDPALRAKALANLGTIAWFREDHVGAVALYDQALAEETFDTPRDRASVLFNLGLLARTGADYPRALDLQRRAAAIYDQQDHPFNLSMAWIGLGWTHLDLGAWESAAAAFARAGAQADRCRFERARLEVVVYRAEATALAGAADAAALPATLGALEALEAQGPFDWRAHESAARVARLAGRVDLAEAQLALALQRSPDPSFGAGTALQERARLRGDPSDWESANVHFRAVGLPGRVDPGPIRELGACVTPWRPSPPDSSRT